MTFSMYLAALSHSSTAIPLHPASLRQIYAGVFLLTPMAIFTYRACSLLNCSLLYHSHISTPYSIPLLASDCIRKSLLRLLVRAFLNILHVAFIAFIIFSLFFLMCFSKVFPVENHTPRYLYSYTISNYTSLYFQYSPFLFLPSSLKINTLVFFIFIVNLFFFTNFSSVFIMLVSPSG